MLTAREKNHSMRDLILVYLLTDDVVEPLCDQSEEECHSNLLKWGWYDNDDRTPSHRTVLNTIHCNYQWSTVSTLYQS